MNSLKYIFSLAFILCFTAGMAQVPGYMGKRASLTIELNPTPALLNMNMNNNVTVDWTEEARTDKSNLLALNIRPQINFEYLVGKKTALIFNYQRIITGTVKEENHDDSEDTDEHYDVLKGNAVGISLKFYRFKKTGIVAPLGRYTSLTASMARVNTFDALSSSQKQFQEDLYYPVLSWGWGKQFMPIPNLLIGTGAEFGLAFLTMNKAQEQQEGVYLSKVEVDNSMSGYSFFSIKLSVGYMLF